MARFSTWLGFYHCDESLPGGHIKELLSQAGISTQNLDLLTSCGPGLLFVGKICPDLYDLVRHVSRGGLERVLTIVTDKRNFTNDDYWQLLRAGSSDIITWELDPRQIEGITGRLERWEQIDKIVASPLVKQNLVGNSTRWQSLLRRIVEVACFTDAAVLIHGESGTGKELVARLIHTLDGRPDKRDLIIVDCTTIVPELSGSEFFGHERGAFTGASNTRDGAFALANEGTLFLDEVGELPMTLQAELLRVIQEGTYKRVGSNSWQHTSFRLVCATNKNLEEEIKGGRFRHDFYYRIGGWKCRLPSLRERSSDIPILVEHFVSQLRNGEGCVELDEPVKKYLFAREYPGNVRDLKQLVMAMMYRHVGSSPISVGDIPEEERPVVECLKSDWSNGSFEEAIQRALSLGCSLKDIGRAAENTAIRIAMNGEDGNLRRAAHKLGVTDRALQLRRATELRKIHSSTSH